MVVARVGSAIASCLLENPCRSISNLGPAFFNFTDPESCLDKIKKWKNRNIYKSIFSALFTLLDALPESSAVTRAIVRAK